ncbi:hypothetical protein EV385_2981 [Krasilnikovia cinnamomea]|uniref:Uncharacterized protein n=1 Tax=Krasilnikovia cinnamomea TaxID=349313 RepID=A0A4Q7ZJV2_9ACTN|nr:DUF6069 family protein [Krasilnikovia cinnamomea]RZU51180.1 hypothetical protein EV385_2981 [Krasilnikovia cinnamomea]
MASSTHGVTPHPTRRVLLRATGMAALGSGAAVAVVHLTATAAGDSLAVTAPGTTTPAGVPLAVAVIAALIGAVAGGVLAALLARTPRPRPLFVALTAIGLVLSFGSPFGAASTTATALWLCVMHGAVAAVTIPVLARALPLERAR